MNTNLAGLRCTLILAILLVVDPAVAAKPEWAGQAKGNNDKNERAQQREDSRSDYRNRDDRSAERRHYFEDKHRLIVREYYQKEFRGGRCPPGLAKKHNGCMPPGQAKKWQYGRPLPRDIVYYEVPRDVVMRIGMPTSGYKYVRVASDILMIAVGTNMVVDAMEDLGR